MAISKGFKVNLETLVQAAKNGDIRLVECTDKITGNAVTVVCATWIDEDEQYNFVPMAKMFNGNPYEELNPPDYDEENTNG